MTEHEIEPEPKQWLTVRETAARLNTSEEMVRRKIRAFELPASRLSDAERAPWMVNAAALERRIEVDAVHRRLRDRGVVTGRSDEGGPVDQEFVAEVGRLNGPEAAQDLRAHLDRHQLFERVEREMYADPGVRQQLERLEEEERFEEEARELARRVRRAERLRDRALEILDEEDED